MTAHHPSRIFVDVSHLGRIRALIYTELASMAGLSSSQLQRSSLISHGSTGPLLAAGASCRTVNLEAKS